MTKHISRYLHVHGHGAWGVIKMPAIIIVNVYVIPIPTLFHLNSREDPHNIRHVHTNKTRECELENEIQHDFAIMVVR